MLIFYVAINTFRSLFRAADSCGSFSFDKDCCQSLGFALGTFEKKSQLTSNFQNLSLSQGCFFQETTEVYAFFAIKQSCW